jgi:glycosyltransferase involved in cell wall biosynthesis
MPRRDAALAEATVGLLRESSALRGWEFLGIHNASESEVATQLRSSELFLSFARREGFGRPPVEALACGSSVIGFSGVAGTEVFESTSAYEVRDGDILALVGAVEDWAENFDRYPGQVREQQLSDAHSIQNAYTPERERQALVDVFGELSELPPKETSTAAMELAQDDVHPVVSRKMRLRRAAHEFKQAWRVR